MLVPSRAAMALVSLSRSAFNSVKIVSSIKRGSSRGSAVSPGLGGQRKYITRTD